MPEMPNELTTRILRQFIGVRDSGACNMFDRDCVQRVAMNRGYIELTLWIQDHKRAYGKLLEAVDAWLAAGHDDPYEDEEDDIEGDEWMFDEDGDTELLEWEDDDDDDDFEYEYD